MNVWDARVVVVGIDEYQEGPSWSLAGPVDDAVRFAEFFVAHGVPPEQVTLLATPLPATLPAGVVGRPADRATIREVFVRELARSRAPTLYVVWGGHGFIDLNRRRRLVYPEATAEDPVDFDLDSMLRRFGTDQVPGLNRQVWVVDACQTHGPRRTAGHESFEAGEAVPGRSLDVYLAAGFGQPAMNLSSGRTGLFSREMLNLLNASGRELLTDPVRLTRELQLRFTRLRASGVLEQTPTYLWFRDSLGNEGQLLRRGAPESPPARAVTLPPAALKPLVDALVEIPEFRRPHDREEILLLVRSAVYASMSRFGSARPDAIGIIRGCLRHPGGLSELVEAVRFFAMDTEPVRRFTEAADRLTDIDEI